MIDEIKKVLKKHRVDGRKVNSIAGDILEAVSQKYGRDNAESDKNYIPRKREDYIHNTKGKKNPMLTGKKGVVLNQGQEWLEKTNYLSK